MAATKQPPAAPKAPKGKAASNGTPEADKQLVTIPLVVITDERTVNVPSNTGRPVQRKMPELVQNDAGILYDILDNIDTAKEPFRGKRRMITRLRRDMRAHRNEAENIIDDIENEESKAGEWAVADWSITIDALRMLVDDVAKNPPENMTFRGAANETLTMLEDVLDAHERAD